MSISTRTPEGDPYRCPICRELAVLETSDAGDNLCPACGHLLWRIRDQVASRLNVPIDELSLHELLELYEDSLERIEQVMRIEDEFGVTPTEYEQREIRTIEDVIRWLRRRGF
jgi:acyl carrier protein